MLGMNITTPLPRLYDAAVSLGTILTLAWAGFLVKMSHRTAATALLLASLPYGLALPQVIPLVSELAPNVTPRPLPLVPAVNASSVTVIGTVIQPSIESAVDDATDAVEDAIQSAASAVESATDAASDTLPTDAPSVLDPEANILPLILPGILPVETDLPLHEPDVVPSDLPILDPGIGDGSFSGDDLPDTNDLEVIDLPPVGEEIPNSDDGFTAPFPDVSDFADLPEAATVPISTFNAVVQPLLSVIQTLLNSLPGNYAPPFPHILPYPLLPTETPDIFIDPLLPTESLDDTPAATSTGTIDPIAPLVDPIPDSVATDLPFAKRFAKRQDVTDAGLSTNSILELLGPIIEAISALLNQIPGASQVADAVEDALPSTLPIDVPALPVDPPVLAIPDISLPDLSAPSNLSADVPAVPDVSDVLPADDLPAPVPELPLPSLPSAVPELPDLTSGIPNEVLNVPVPDDIEGIDWAAFESPPFSDLPPVTQPLDDVIPSDVLNVPVPDFDEFGNPIEAPVDTVSDATGTAPVALPTSLDALGDVEIPADIPVDAPLNAVSDATAAAPIALPTSLDAFDDLNDLLDWPFEDIPETIAPDATGELPDLTDLPIPSDVLNVPVPDLDDQGIPIDVPPAALPTDDVACLLLPAPALTLSFPSEIIGLAAPTDLLDIPVPEGFEDVAEVPAPTALPAPPLPALKDADIPWDVLNVPVPDLDEFGNPLDTPIEATGVVADAPLPTDLNFFDIPVPEGFEDATDALDLPAPAVPTAVVPDVADVPIPDDILNIPVPDFDENGLPIDDAAAAALPTDAFGAGFPIQALPDVPLVLPTETGPADTLPSLPADSLLPAEGLPTDALTGLTAVTTDALSGLPTDILADVVSAPTLPTDALTSLPVPAPAVPAVPAVDNATAVVTAVPIPDIPSVAAPALSSVPTGVVPPVAAPTAAIPTLASVVPALPVAVPKLPLQLSGVRPPLEKRQLAFLSKPKAPAVAAPAVTTPNPVDTVAIKLIKPLLSLVSALIKTIPVVGPKIPVPDLGAALPALPAVPAVPGIPAVDGVVGGVASSLPVPSVLPALPSLPVPDVASILPVLVPGVASILPAVPALTGVPDVASILPAVPSILPALDVASILPADLSAVGDLTSDLPAVADLTSGLPALPTDALPAVSDLQNNLPAVDTLLPDTLPALTDLSNVGNVASTVTGAVSAVPGIGETVSTVTDAVPAAPDVADLLPELPTGPIPRIRKRQLGSFTGVLGGGAPKIPAVGGVFSTATGALGAVPGAGGLLAGTPKLPNLAGIVPAGIVPAAPGLPNLGGVASTVTGALGGGVPKVPDVGGLTSTVTGALGTVPGVGGLAGGLPAVPKVALPFGSAGFPDTAQITDLIGTLTTLINSLLSTVKDTAPVPLPALPVQKRQVGLVGIDKASIPSALAPEVVSTDALYAVIQGLLRVAGQLIANLPVTPLQQVGLINELGNLGKRHLPHFANGLPLGGAVANAVRWNTITSAVPLNTATATGTLKPLQAVAASVLPSLFDLVKTLLTLVPEPLKTPAAAVPGTVLGATFPATNVAAGLTQTLPISAPLIRRAVEEFQQGPASDWEAFLSELDESNQGELHRLVHDSAKAVNNDDLESLTAQLKEDFALLSAETKSKLQSAAPVLANMQKRTMRHGKRADVPGVQSIGPNLDDAQKVDLSFLGATGSLNPFRQPLGNVAPEPLADDVLDASDAPTFLPGELPDSSVDIGTSPEAAALLAAGGLDPYGMNSPVGGSPVDDPSVVDPYADIRPTSWDAALGQAGPEQALEGLDATIQAAKSNKFTERPSNPIPFEPILQGGSAAAAQAAAKGAQQQGVAQEQGEVLKWFYRFVKPSWNKDIDAEIVG